MIKSLMRVTKMNVWQLAEKLNTNYRSLIADTQSPGLKKRITELMIENGLCPECGNHYVPQGGCKYCLCGWEMC